MKRRVAGFAILALLMHCAGGYAQNRLPAVYEGVWSTPDSVFSGNRLWGGIAVYISEDGAGALVGAPLPVQRCDGNPCAPIIGMRFDAHVESDPNTLLIKLDDGGPTRAGVGFTYDPQVDTITLQFGERGKVLHRMARALPAEIDKALHAPDAQQSSRPDSGSAPLPLP
jgi:hypothetical protein